MIYNDKYAQTIGKIMQKRTISTASEAVTRAYSAKKYHKNGFFHAKPMRFTR